MKDGVGTRNEVGICETSLLPGWSASAAVGLRVDFAVGYATGAGVAATVKLSVELIAAVTVISMATLAANSSTSSNTPIL